MPKLIKGVGCPYCGSSCDDVEVLVSDDETKILEVHNACIIGTNLFHHANDPTRPKLPRMRQPDGSMKEINYDEAVDYFAKTLLAAKKPLIYGFGSTNCEGMSAVARIAEKAGAVLDNCATICHGPSFLAMFDNGYPKLHPRGSQEPCRCRGLLGLQPDARPPPPHLPVLDLPPRLLYPERPDAADHPLYRPARDRYRKTCRPPPDARPGP